MNKAEAKRKLQDIETAQNIDNYTSNLSRARSITVGTAFGGTTEIMMRSDGGRHIWCVMQPVEVIELIHQLAANVGCLIAIKPREDFSSWRGWKVSEEEKLHLQGHPHFPNDMAPHARIGADPRPEENKSDSGGNNLAADPVTGVLANKMVNNGTYMLGGEGGKPASFERTENEHAMATKKTVNKRSAKRATKAS